MNNRRRLLHPLGDWKIMPNYCRASILCVLTALAAANEGCRRGPAWNTGLVEGTVTWAGRPLTGVQVVFWVDVASGGQGPRAVGLTDDAGRYKLTTDAGDSGAAVGSYRVCLLVLPEYHDQPEEMRLPKVKAKQAVPSEAAQLPPIYANFEKTPLRAEVHAGAQTIDFHIP